MKKEFKIVFFGTPLFGAIILEELAKTKYKPSLLITETDKPFGRKKELKCSECKLMAQKYNIKIIQEKDKKNLFLILKKESPDLIITAAYGNFLKKEILDLPKYGAYNIHPSLLPKYRGPSPIQSAILNGDKKTGVSIFKMNEKMDEGDIISKEEIEIKNDEDYPNLSKRLAYLSADSLIKIIPKILNKKIKLKRQDNSKTTYTKIIEKKDGKVNWNKNANEIERKIRAFTPWPGIFTFFKKGDKKNLRLKILKVKVLKNNNEVRIGEVFITKENEPAIKCKEDGLILKEMQIEGKKTVSGKDFIIGNRDIIGTILF